MIELLFLSSKFSYVLFSSNNLHSMIGKDVQFSINLLASELILFPPQFLVILGLLYQTTIVVSAEADRNQYELTCRLDLLRHAIPWYFLLLLFHSTNDFHVEADR